ncbi:MAG TPA: hypothetical protein DCR20_05675 [Planctomycetaceae bacterium]|nr:hypothetical protein [Planctomycetaceae bacterium]
MVQAAGQFRIAGSQGMDLTRWLRGADELSPDSGPGRRDFHHRTVLHCDLNLQRLPPVWRVPIWCCEI